MGHAMRLLVVEENEDDCILLEHAILRSGLQIAAQFVRTGAQALDYLVSCALKGFGLPSVVLLELDLPGVNGLEVARQIRARLEFAAVKIVMWSGAVSPWMQEAGYETGAALILGKPADTSTLETNVKALYGLGEKADFVAGGLGI